MKNLFQNFGEHTAAVSDDGKKLSYQELFNETARIKEAVGHRTLVFSFCSNCFGALTGYVAFLSCRIVPLLLSEKMDDALFTRLMELYQPEYLWMPAEKTVPGMEVLEEQYACYGYKLLRTRYGRPKTPLYEDLALLLTTSGSTGSPKLVRQSYRNIESNTQSIVSYLQLDASERPVTTLPMNYTYGLSIINTHLYAGATLLLTDKNLLHEEFWQFFREQGATSFGGVPYTYEILDKLDMEHMELPTLRTMTQAGGKLSLRLHWKFAEYAQKRQIKFVVMYGQTEATARMAYLPPEMSLQKYGSMGIAVPGGRFELMDPDGHLISETDVVGELVYYGENVTLGYASRQEDLCLGDERGGRLVTGDMAWRDADGYYYIAGRKKRFLKIFGNRVSLDECEQMLRAAFAGADCACIGNDERMHIFITQDLHPEQVKKYLSERTKLHLSAFRVHVTDRIPKNDAGKTLYNELEQMINE